MSAASDRRARAGAAVDRVFGERLLIQPRVKSQYKGFTADPMRLDYVLVGRITVSPSRDSMQGLRGGTAWATMAKVSGAHTLLVIHASELARLSAGCPEFAIRQDDRIVRIDKAGEPAFSIADAPISGTERLIAILTEDQSST